VWSTVPLVFIRALSEPSVEQAPSDSTLSLYTCRFYVSVPAIENQ